jgi:hypothetical protein
MVNKILIITVSMARMIEAANHAPFFVNTVAINPSGRMIKTMPNKCCAILILILSNSLKTIAASGHNAGAA